ncbi:acyl-CoA desaturase [Yinghuangia sp. ASG 101]|uniref:acyl-CoA desaturase n=1 Tax=Yinghuangia sp. ASG 101 TaxID=2896848 RepID=UPI001E4418E2|nr:acyl-CoA desaturase [Yinghuangia sp. ASG 101]UGQ14507.1 acyl-CoA desaturase [Yinghuangia sp. ASG 101]
MTPPSGTAVLATETETPTPSPIRGTLGGEQKNPAEQIALALFIGIPFAALIAAVPVMWGWGLSWVDIALVVVMYAITGHGITIGFHRYFTHGSFKAGRKVRVALAIAGNMAVQGPLVRWVADHRKHHKFSDQEGDPHSPWRYGGGVRNLAKGMWWSHMGWLFDPEQTPQDKYAPDLLKDATMVRVSRQFPMWVAVSLTFPALVGGLVTWSWQGALTAFFWAGLVRVALLHHVTWSINSICHAVGKQPFRSRDKSTNVWWLAIPSMGESWHNLHHADQTAARHGVLRGQLDTSARIIRWMEKLGWVSDVRWPDRARIASRRAA